MSENRNSFWAKKDVCTRVYPHTRTHKYALIHTHTSTRTHISTHTYIPLHTYTHMLSLSCTHTTHTHTHIHTHMLKQKGRDAGRNYIPIRIPKYNLLSLQRYLYTHVFTADRLGLDNQRRALPGLFLPLSVFLSYLWFFALGRGLQ